MRGKLDGTLKRQILVRLKKCGNSTKYDIELKVYIKSYRAYYTIRA